MKWRNHKLCTFALVFAATGRLLPAFIAGIGSILPDLLEMRLVRHRTLTHWPFTYVIGIVVLLPLVKVLTWWGWLIVSCLLIGCLLHLAEDGLSKGGIPLFSPAGKRYGAGWYVTDTITETFMAVGIVVVAVYFSWRRGFLSADFLADEVNWLLFWG
ncbi:metal-dependent hydrolase [Geothermobacter hydrogeniphilus]|uniref:LexA-binding, inner membrane-associated hydrolase n=1 Tax=Geothermobacter hydrogeniphilus TaxID=1969733 RepID=A0A1X0Y8C5_9BACT|nr:metal-dependent hydrolase [Geothermobacter hydrogeniphilus]ORJ61343.1 hypothetical protein B5V00_06840 [Geothermobacter hydrogeniphilus]